MNTSASVNIIVRDAFYAEIVLQIVSFDDKSVLTFIGAKGSKYMNKNVT